MSKYIIAKLLNSQITETVIINSEILFILLCIFITVLRKVVESDRLTEYCMTLKLLYNHTLH
jgi:hypothetical protein